jgi:uncharacterized membrane protein YbaN (DUF454 family)
VISAEASEVTGNILILFDPRQTSEKALLAELQAICSSLPAVAAPQPAGPVPPAVHDNGADRNPHQAEAAVYLTGPAGRLYKALGWSSIGMAVVGAATPGIPTTPFVILAGYFFIRSSPAAHDWLLQSRWFGPMLRDWEEQRGVKRSVKYMAVGLIGAGMVFTSLIGLPAALVATILALEVIGLAVVLSLPVVEPTPSS